MKVFRIAILIVLFLLGAVCLVWYFRTGDTDNTEKREASGLLLTDTSPLGELSVLSDGKTLAAGNARGEVKKVFSVLMRYRTSKLSASTVASSPPWVRMYSTPSDRTGVSGM